MAASAAHGGCRRGRFLHCNHDHASHYRSQERWRRNTGPSRAKEQCDEKACCRSGPLGALDEFDLRFRSGTCLATRSQRELGLERGTALLSRAAQDSRRAIAIETFLERVREEGFTPKRVHFAVRRYGRWIEVNPQATTEARGKMLGVVRLHNDPGDENGEFAVIVRSRLKGHGLGWILMKHMITYAKAKGLKSVRGQVLAENRTMLQMCSELGFHIVDDPTERGVKIVTLPLEEVPAEAMH